MEAALPDTFYKLASSRLAELPGLPHEWVSGPDGKRSLRIPKLDESGFDITIECESNGLHPFAEGWHGAPWEANTPDMSIEEVAEDCLGFVRTLLCPDATLTVHYSGGRPYRWILRYPTLGAPVKDETGLLFFNYFGRRETREFRNTHLPPRES
jgi:hypothetical protein